MKILLNLLYRTALALLLVNSSDCLAASIPPVDQWKTECVGLYQISVPGEVEETVTSMDGMYGKVNASDSGIRFSDGDGPGEAEFYVDGEIQVSPIFSAEEFQKYWEKYSHMINSRTGLKTTPDLDNKAFYENWPKGAAAALYRKNRVYTFEYYVDTSFKETLTDAQRRRDAFLKNFTPRQLFEIPPQRGGCFPYGFVKTTGKEQVDVGVGMRLINHPDVEIFFLHDTAGNDGGLTPQYRGSQGAVRRFWAHYGPTEGNKLDGLFKHYHSVKLGGYEGVYATATIARPRESGDDDVPYETQEQYSARMRREMAAGKYPLDYGYMACVQGHWNHGAHIPKLMLYVIRTAKRARDAGIEPVSKDELYKMAKEIAASIKLKPVQ